MARAWADVCNGATALKLPLLRKREADEQGNVILTFGKTLKE